MPERKRRQYGTGSVMQRADGYWWGRIDAGWLPTGVRRRISVVRKTEAACKAALKAKVRELEDGGAPVAGASSRATVKSWAETWLESTVHDKRPHSYATDASAIRKWVIPTIGHQKLEQLTPGDIRAVANEFRKAGRSTSTARRTHIVLAKMLRDAVLEGHNIPPRVLLVKPPNAADNDRDAIDLADALALLRAAGDLPDGSRWAAGFLQGIRQAEALGLTWPRVDLDNGLIDISWQLQAIPYAHGCGQNTVATPEPPATLRHQENRRSGVATEKPKCGRRFGGDCPDRQFRVPDGYRVKQLDGALCLVIPKTSKGQRIIPLVPWMVSALRAWKDTAPPSPHGLVWPRPDGRPQSAASDADAFVALQDAAQVARVEDSEGRRYTGHEMRHTCATLLQESGVDDRTITAILGHASIVSSKAYIHIGQEATRKAMADVAARLQLS